MVQLTPQQALAITTRDVSVALSAGAGCGKTSVLTQRFLSHLQPGPDQLELSSIVAITFTDKAAREMRERIRAACLGQVQTCPPAQLDHWLKILRGLDAARVSTIHAFCGGLLRSSAIEAGLDPEFATLDAPVAATALQTAVETTAEELLRTGDTDFKRLAVRYSLEGVLGALPGLVMNRHLLNWDEFAELSADELLARWDRWRSESFLPQWRRRTAAMPLLVQLRDFLPQVDAKTEKLTQRVAELQGVLENLATSDQPLVYLEALQSLAKVQDVGKANWNNLDQLDQAKTLFTKVRDFARKSAAILTWEPENAAAAAELCVSWNRVGRQVVAAYEAEKTAQNGLDFDDLLIRARDLLRDNTVVREKLGRSIRLLMVDEFQDTDPVQADLVRALCGTALRSGRLFLVGDRKQSIYRFRGADPRVFATLREEIPERGRLPLTMNFRSQPPILHFVNAVFAAEMRDDYEALIPSIPPLRDIPASIEFLWATHELDPERNGNPAVDAASNTTESAGDSSGDDADDASLPQLRAREADWIARRIRQLLDDPSPRVRTKSGGLRPVEQGDIVLLFRALTNVEVYEDALRRYGLEYYLVGGRAFFAQQEIFDIAHLYRFIDQPLDALSLIGLLRSPMFGFSDDLIHRLATHSETLYDSLFERSETPPAGFSDSDLERIDFARNVLGELREQRDRLSLAGLLQRALDLTGYDALLLNEFLGDRKIANLQKVLDLARTCDQAGTISRREFVTQLMDSISDETKEELAATHPETSSVIRLMSIHQSKGLEFPVVFVVDLNRKTNVPSSGAIVEPSLGAMVSVPKEAVRPIENPAIEMVRFLERAEEAEELQRLLYVAMTRARDVLILSASSKGDITEAKIQPWMATVARVFHLDTGLLRSDPLLATGTRGVVAPEDIPQITVHRTLKSTGLSETPDDGYRWSMAKLLEKLPDAEPEPWPEIVDDIPPAADPRSMLSVSRLEEALGDSEHEPQPSLFAGVDEETDITLRKGEAEILGTLVHGVLEVVDFSDPEQFTSRLKTFIARMPSPPSSELVETARRWLETLGNSPLAAELAGAKAVWREIDFAIDWPTTFAGESTEPPPRPLTLIGQIDVLMQTEEGWSLLDYKTSHVRDSQTDEQLLAPYRLQLAMYALAAERVLGQPLTRAELIFARPRLRRVVWSLAEETSVTLRNRIAKAIDLYFAAPVVQKD